MTDAEFWEGEAQQQSRNTVYYRGLVERIGNAIGKPAYTCDNGDVSQSVLCAKVPELVEALQAENADLRERLHAENLAAIERISKLNEAIRDADPREPSSLKVIQ